MIKVKILILAATAALALGGCSLMAKLESPAAQPFDAAAVAVGVDAIVAQGTPAAQAARAASIKLIATEVLAADVGTTATLATLESVAAAKVATLKLPPGDQAAASLFLAVVSSAVSQYATKAQSNATVTQVQAAVATVLGWVIAECNKFIPAVADLQPAGGDAIASNFLVLPGRGNRLDRA